MSVQAEVFSLEGDGRGTGLAEQPFAAHRPVRNASGCGRIRRRPHPGGISTRNSARLFLPAAF